MKKNYTGKTLFIITVMAGGLYSCKESPKKEMHVIPVDSTVAVLSRPVNTDIVSNITAITPVKGMRIYSVPLNGMVTYDSRKKATISSRVAGRIEKLTVKYNFQPIRKGELIMEIYSPDLAAAQRELLLINKSANAGDNMLAKAKQRLQLLGMQPAQIEQVIQSGNILYRVPVYSNSDGYILEQSSVGGNTVASIAAPAAAPAMGGMENAVAATRPAATASSPILLRVGEYVNPGQPLFTIYQAGNLIGEFALSSSVASQVKKDQKLLFYAGSQKENIKPATIGLIEPALQDGRNFSIARIYLTNNNLKPGELLTGYLPVIFNSGFWIPKQSILALGSRSVVFKKSNNTYTPADVKTGAEIKDMVQIMTNMEGWQIASNAYYLVDSESFIKTKQAQD